MKPRIEAWCPDCKKYVELDYIHINPDGSVEVTHYLSGARCHTWTLAKLAREV